jgi:hypothetical protein
MTAAPPISPARIRASAVTELHALAEGTLSIRSLVVGLLRIAQDPHGAGVSLGPGQDVFYRNLEDSNRIVLYTVGSEQNVTIEGFRRATAL